AHARLDSEFFPESILRRSWSGEVAYSAVLRQRRVDDVMIWRGYLLKYHVNEGTLLQRLAGEHLTDCNGPRVCVSLAAQTRSWRLYRVMRQGHAPLAPASA